MARPYSDGPAWIELTPRYVDALHRHGAAALERLRAFGYADRRESGIALLLAGGVPLAGMLLLDWSPASVVLAVLLNLLLNLYGDLWKILRKRGRLEEQARWCIQDDFVWPVARALLRRRSTVYGKYLPSPESLDHPQPGDAPFVFAILATIAVAIPAYVLFRDDALYAEPATLLFGTLPNVVLFAGAALVQSFGRNVRWRDAASVRLGTAGFDAGLTLYAGLAASGFFVTVVRDPVDPAIIAALIAAGAVGCGMHRLLAAARLQGPAHWLERELETRARYAHLYADAAPRT